MRSHLIGVFFIAVYAFAQVGDVVVYRGGNTTADKVTFTPSGNIAGATVKAAIEELDSEKLATGGTAVKATALAANGGNCGAGNYPLGVDASGAVEGCTVDGTGTDDQTAAEVPVTPAGNIASTNAGDAFNELDDEKLVAIPAVNAQEGTTYTLQASDNGKVVTLTNANAITLTVASGLTVGINCFIVQGGAGQVTFSASGTTINQRLSYTKTAGQYAVASLVSYATDVFVLSGDLQ